MKTLFIIGNGMDIDHKLKTKWKDIFEDYFKSLETKGGIENYLFQLLLEFKNDLWSDFEGWMEKIYHSVHYWFTQKAGLERLEDKYQKEINKYLAQMLSAIKLINEDIEKYDVDSYDHSEEFVKKHLNKNKLFNKNINLINLKNHLINSIQNIVKKGIKIKELNKRKIINFYKAIFKIKNDDYFVINYNYTTFYESGEYKYYDREKAWHIHGTIDEKNNIWDRKVDTFRNPLQYNTLFGTYSLLEGISEDDFICDIEDKKKYKILHHYLFEYMLDYRKRLSNEEINKYKNWIEDRYEKLVIIGHSISKNDMNYLSKINLNLSNIKEIKVISHWDSDSSFLEIKSQTKLKIKDNLLGGDLKKFKNILKIQLLNTYDRQAISLL